MSILKNSTLWLGWREASKPAKIGIRAVCSLFITPALICLLLSLDNEIDSVTLTFVTHVFNPLFSAIVIGIVIWAAVQDHKIKNKNIGL